MLKSFVKIKDLRIYYEKDGEGEAILCLHGWGGRTESLRPICNILKGMFTIYSLDLPGFGRSFLPPFSWQTSDYGLFIKAFLEHFKIQRPDIIGHSFGGKIALWIAANYPDLIKRLVLISPSGLKKKRRLGYYFKVFIGKIAKGLPFNLKDMIYEKIGSDDYKASGRMKPTLLKVLKEDFRPLLSKILAKTLIIWGENDKETPLYQGKIMEKEIKDAKLEIIKDSGHFCYLEKPQYVSSIIFDFLCGS